MEKLKQKDMIVIESKIKFCGTFHFYGQVDYFILSVDNEDMRKTLAGNTFGSNGIEIEKNLKNGIYVADLNFTASENYDSPGFDGEWIRYYTVENIKLIEEL